MVLKFLPKSLSKPSSNNLLGRVYNHITGRLDDFFSAKSSPFNLAVFRIVLFGAVLAKFDLPYTQFMASLPAELKFLPGNFGWLFNYLPVNPAIVQAIGPVFIAACIAGMLGIFSRVSAIVALLLGIYLLGIPQIFGKVNHYHHLLWFVGILAASRCADVLSLDAIFKGWKRADRGLVEPPKTSQIYALPLRFVWLTIGLIYLFPGLAKLEAAGLNWALSDNLKYQLYEKWLSLDGWTPIFRLDRFPLLYKSAALGSVLFEIAFIFLLFYPSVRLFAVIGGLIFHNMTNLLMRISFWHLQICYVAFFNWHGIFNRIGRALFKRDMYVVYDGNCQLCRRTIATLRGFDVFGRITYVNALNEDALNAAGLNWLDRSAILQDMHAVVGRKCWLGFDAYRALSSRIPLLWLTLPFLFIPPIPAIGKGIYRHVADHRTCSIVRAHEAAAEQKPFTRFDMRLVAIVGSFIIAMVAFEGLVGDSQSWPFARYPTFARIAGPTTSKLNIVALARDGSEIPFDDSLLRDQLQTPRYMGLIGNILEEEPEPSPEKLKAFWQLAVNADPALQATQTVQFYKLTLITEPEQQSKNPLDRTLIYEFALKQ